MRYILSQDGEEGIFYSRYLDYLKTIETSLPNHIYQFASSEKYFTLNSPHSLHDSWLNSVEIQENRNRETPFEPVVTITLKLFGQLHDRIIILEYEGVTSYDLTGKKNTLNWEDTFHGDVFTHEIRLAEKGSLIHEILFASDSTFLIECRNFTHREELLSSNSS